MSSLEPFVRVASSLPAMPEVAQQLIRSMDRDDLSLPEVARLVSRDNTLAAKILRTANSARYSPSRDISSLGDAAATLGLRTMRDLALSACLAGAFPECPGLDRLAFWRGTLAMATYMQPVARALGLDEDSAYVAGLMLRTGQLLMAAVDAPAAQRVARAAHLVDDRFALERAAFGCSHAEVSAELARCWKFPRALASAFAAAGDPLDARPFDRLGAGLRIASVVTDCREIGVPVEQGLPDAQAELLAHLQLDVAWLAAHLPDHALATAGVESLLQ